MVREQFRMEKEDRLSPFAGRLASIGLRVWQAFVQALHLDPRQTLILVLASIPVLVLLDFYAFAVSTAVHLGHWPRVGENHPPRLLVGWWQAQIGLGLVFYPATSFTALLGTWILRWRNRDIPAVRLTLWIALAAALPVIAARVDPGGCFNWFWD
jgi:hypothetical protein